MSLPRRTFVFSQRELDKEDIINIAAALDIEETTEFIHPSTDITVEEAKDNFDNLDDVIFADDDKHGLYVLTEFLDSYLDYLENYALPEAKLSDATMAFLQFE